VLKCPLSRYRYTGSKGEVRYSSYSFLTAALDGDEWSASRPGRALALGEDPLYPLDRRLGGSQSWSGHEARGKALCQGSRVASDIAS
jgi:hypothetical protein